MGNLCSDPKNVLVEKEFPIEISFIEQWFKLEYCVNNIHLISKSIFMKKILI